MDVTTGYDPDRNANVTKNPYHPRADRFFADNFSELRFKVNGVQIDHSIVVGAFVRRGCVLVLKFDDNDEVLISRTGGPQTVELNGVVEIIGTPLLCPCPKRHRVRNWWDVELLEPCKEPKPKAPPRTLGARSNQASRRY